MHLRGTSLNSRMIHKFGAILVSGANHLQIELCFFGNSAPIIAFHWIFECTGSRIMILPCPYHGVTKRLLHRWCAGPTHDWAELKGCHTFGVSPLGPCDLLCATGAHLWNQCLA